MKARVQDQIRTLVDIPADFNGETLPKGALEMIVECYERPEGYAVDLAIAHPTLVGGFEYKNVILLPEQFVVI